MQVARIESHEKHIRERKLQNSPSVIDRRDSLDDMPIEIAIVVLREIDEISRTVVIDSDVDTRELIQAHIMVADYTDDRHQIAQSGSESSIHS